MLASEIIAKFELYVDDSTELSTQEELDLLNKVYQKVADDRPWEILKKRSYRKYLRHYYCTTKRLCSHGRELQLDGQLILNRDKR